MKLKNSKLTAAIALSLFLQSTTAYMSAKEIINDNDGTSAQPTHASTAINVNDNDSTSTDTYVGIHTSGNNAKTIFSFANPQPNITMNRQNLNQLYQAYGIINENGGQTVLQTGSNSDALNLQINAYLANVQAVINTVANSNVTIGNTNNGAAISVAASSSTNQNNRGKVPINTTVSAIKADNNAENTIFASDISAQITKDYNYNILTNDSYSDGTLSVLNTAIDRAADNYVAIANDYASYADEKSYLTALANAQQNIY